MRFDCRIVREVYTSLLFCAIILKHMARSASGQATALSRLYHGFESRTRYHLSITPLHKGVFIIFILEIYFLYALISKFLFFNFIQKV